MRSLLINLVLAQENGIFILFTYLNGCQWLQIILLNY